VTKPFSFEAPSGVSRPRRRARPAREVDTLIVIPDDRLLQICDEKVSMQDAFRIADDVLRRASRHQRADHGASIVNLDFATCAKICRTRVPR